LDYVKEQQVWLLGRFTRRMGRDVNFIAPGEARIGQKGRALPDAKRVGGPDKAHRRRGIAPKNIATFNTTPKRCSPMAGTTFTRYDAPSYARVAAMKRRSRAGGKPAKARDAEGPQRLQAPSQLILC
jgi:hypothetical protein